MKIESWELSVMDKFDAAHYLPNYDGKCKRLHGHTWRVEVAVTAVSLRESGNESGMVIDFSRIKSLLKKVIKKFDHQVMNNIIKNPTAELIAKFIWDDLSIQIKKMKGISLAFVRVWETDNSSVRYVQF